MYIRTRKNEIIFTAKHKHCAMEFLTSRSVSIHVLFALVVDHTDRDAVKVGVPTRRHSNYVSSLILRQNATFQTSNFQ